MSILANSGPKANLPREVYTALVDTLFGTVGSFISGVIGGLLVPVIAYWRSNDPIYLASAAIMLALGGYRIGVFLWRQRTPEEERLRDAEIWERRYAIGGISFMLAVGLTAALLCYRQPDAVTVLYGVVIALGCVGQLAGRNAGRPLIVYGQCLAICVPLGLVFLLHFQGWYTGLSAILLLILVSSKSTTKFLNQVLVSTLQNGREAQVQRSRFGSALDSMSHGLCMADKDGEITVMNRRMRQFFGITQEAEPMSVRRLAEQIAAAGRLPHEARASFIATFEDHFGSRTASLFTETLDGRVYDFRCEPRPKTGMVVVVEDVTEAREASRQIEHMAHFDALTGLPNRAHFHAQLQNRLTHTPSGPRRGLALLSIDLDRFKEVNDTRGHPTGDALLALVAKRLRGVVKKGDLVSRFGGDEFQVLMTVDPTNHAAVESAARRIISALSATYTVGGQVITIGASIGIAFVSASIDTADELVRCADLALYRAKADGKGVCREFSPELDLAQKRKNEIETDLRDAILEDRLELHYQPVVDLRTGKVVVCEALVRMNHPTKGRIPPNEFIGIAEETGLIVQLGAWVMRRACQDAMSWPDDVVVAVNMSAKEFVLRPDVAGDILAILAETGLPAHRLEVEITESTIIEASDAMNQLRAIHEAGLKITLDDFGTGYSSLSYLRQFPVDKIKIDRSFAEDITSKASQAVIGSVSVLADLLGVDLVMEGIETDEQLTAIRRWRAPLIQGYLFSPPLPLARLLPMLAEEVTPPALRALRQVA